MIVFLLVLIFLAILVPGFLRGVFGALGLLVIILLLVGVAHSETWKKDTYGYETWRSDTGKTWKKDQYGYETWRSNSGQVCKRDRYGSGVTCTK